MVTVHNTSQRRGVSSMKQMVKRIFPVLGALAAVFLAAGAGTRW